MSRYYDAILGLIPLALFGVTAALVAAGVGFTTAAPVGATVSAALMGHAMFVRAPVDRPSESDYGSSQSSPLEPAD